MQKVKKHAVAKNRSFRERAFSFTLAVLALPLCIS